MAGSGARLPGVPSFEIRPGVVLRHRVAGCQAGGPVKSIHGCAGRRRRPRSRRGAQASRGRSRRACSGCRCSRVDPPDARHTTIGGAAWGNSSSPAASGSAARAGQLLCRPVFGVAVAAELVQRLLLDVRQDGNRPSRRAARVSVPRSGSPTQLQPQPPEGKWPLACSKLSMRQRESA